MNIIWHVLCTFLVLITNYSYGRYTDRWVQTNDQALIDESLRTVFSRYDFGLDINTVQSKITKLVCKTQIHNGIHIKLYFELDQQMWKCMLYKSLVQTLSMVYDKCDKVTSENTSEETQQTENESQVKNEVQSKDFDDEAEIDALRQNEETKTNNDENQVDDNNNKLDEQENANKQAFEEKDDERDLLNNENQNDNGDDGTDDVRENLENENQESEKSPSDDNVNTKDEAEQNPSEDTNNLEAKANEDETEDKNRNE